MKLKKRDENSENNTLQSEPVISEIDAALSEPEPAPRFEPTQLA